MSETGEIFVGGLRVFGTDRSGASDVFEDGERVGRFTEQDLRGLIEDDEHEDVPEGGCKIAPTDNNPTRGEASDMDVEAALDDYNKIGNADLVTDVLEELDRIEPSKMDSSECEAFGDVIQGLAYLQESLGEEERRPNAKVHEPYEVTDD